MKAILYDTETTGLLKPSRVPVEQQPRIIEFACLIVDQTGAIEHEYHTLFDPQVQVLDPKITKITGLTLRDLHGQPLFRDMVGHLANLFCQAQMVIGHNLDFDLGMLRNELRRMSYAFQFPMPEHRICTIQEYQHLYGRWLKQGELYQHFMRRPQAKAHRALDDVKALHECLVAANFFREVMRA